VGMATGMAGARGDYRHRLPAAAHPGCGGVHPGRAMCLAPLPGPERP
jgi:hypothetical protein